METGNKVKWILTGGASLFATYLAIISFFSGYQSLPDYRESLNKELPASSHVDSMLSKKPENSSYNENDSGKSGKDLKNPSKTEIEPPKLKPDVNLTNLSVIPKKRIPPLYDRDALGLMFPRYKNSIFWADGEDLGLDPAYALPLRLSEYFTPDEIWFADPSYWQDWNKAVVECKIIFSATFKEDNEIKHVILFRTQLFPNNELGCHSCGAALGGTLFYYDDQWRIVFGTANFAEEYTLGYGGFGVYDGGKPKLVKIGPEKHGFVLGGGGTYQGYTIGSYVLVTFDNNGFYYSFSETISQYWSEADKNLHQSAEVTYFEGENPDYYDLRYVLTDEDNKQTTTIYSFKDNKYIPPLSSSLDY